MDYLLETSVVRSVLSNDVRIITRLAGLRPPDRIVTSVITEGELLFGVARVLGERSQALARQIAGFLGMVSDVLPVTSAVASAYADLYGDLANRSRVIPVNDMWIAATAISSGLILVAHDRHFRNVRKLKLEDWLA